jgi:glycosyltransferase involved in cell wall biosynthesis
MTLVSTEVVPPHHTKKVSVVAANYNNASFLVDYFEAWKKSTIQPSEHIFVDDGSTDDSLKIARRYEEQMPSLIIVELGRNLGFGNALNAGIERARGEYILRIDPDDVAHPERVATQLEILESGAADVVGSNASMFQSPGMTAVGLSNFPEHHQDIASTIMRGEHGVLHPTVMARAELFRSNPYVQTNVPAEDYDIFARMLLSGARFYNVQQPLIKYRIHQRSASNVLPFSTIRNTYRIRDEIFNTHTPKIAVWLYYLHIKFYRKHLFSAKVIPRITYLGLASALRPDKAAKRLFRAAKAKINVSAA